MKSAEEIKAEIEELNNGIDHYNELMSDISCGQMAWESFRDCRAELCHKKRALQWVLS